METTTRCSRDDGLEVATYQVLHVGGQHGTQGGDDATTMTVAMITTVATTHRIKGMTAAAIRVLCWAAPSLKGDDDDLDNDGGTRAQRVATTTGTTTTVTGMQQRRCGDDKGALWRTKERRNDDGAMKMMTRGRLGGAATTWKRGGDGEPQGYLLSKLYSLCSWRVLEANDTALQC